MRQGIQLSHIVAYNLEYVNSKIVMRVDECIIIGGAQNQSKLELQ